MMSSYNSIIYYARGFFFYVRQSAVNFVDASWCDWT